MRPTVYIPNFNGERHLGAALESLRAQSRPVDVVVVDNASSDSSVELVREGHPEVTLLRTGANLGFGPALNRAVREHPADPIILFNNDAVASPRFVEALLDEHATGAEAVAGVLTQ
ncbi:MAG TPA: glycosyltransferase, partial [Solirubrobacterales bacterium]|nr:glycosyltransferase [Solirubrobacterales bacterium]